MSVNLKMSFWSLRLDQNTNKKFDNFCPPNFLVKVVGIWRFVKKVYKKHMRNWILHRCYFEGWTKRAWPSKPLQPEWVGQPCPVVSAQTLVQDFNSFSIITTTYQKIGDLLCLVIFLDFCTLWMVGFVIFCVLRRIFVHFLHFKASWCILIHYDAFWCIEMHLYVLWCILMHSNAFKHIMMQSQASWLILM